MSTNPVYVSGMNTRAESQKAYNGGDPGWFDGPGDRTLLHGTAAKPLGLSVQEGDLYVGVGLNYPDTADSSTFGSKLIATAEFILANRPKK